MTERTWRHATAGELHPGDEVSNFGELHADVGVAIHDGQVSMYTVDGRQWTVDASEHVFALMSSSGPCGGCPVHES